MSPPAGSAEAYVHPLPAGLDRSTLCLSSRDGSRLDDRVQQRLEPKEQFVALGVPLAFLYCEENDVAELLLALGKLPAKRRHAVVSAWMEDLA